MLLKKVTLHLLCHPTGWTGVGLGGCEPEPHDGQASRGVGAVPGGGGEGRGGAAGVGDGGGGAEFLRLRRPNGPPRGHPLLGPPSGRLLPRQCDLKAATHGSLPVIRFLIANGVPRDLADERGQLVRLLPFPSSLLVEGERRVGRPRRGRRRRPSSPSSRAAASPRAPRIPRAAPSTSPQCPPS